MSFFGKKKAEDEERRKQLRVLMTHIRDQLESGDMIALRKDRARLRQQWDDVPDGDERDEALSLLAQLDRRIEALDMNDHERRLGPCPHCGSTSYRASKAMQIDDVLIESYLRTSPRFRLVVCEDCGATSMFMDPGDLDERFPWRLQAKLDKNGGPFR